MRFQSLFFALTILAALTAAVPVSPAAQDVPNSAPDKRAYNWVSWIVPPREGRNRNRIADLSEEEAAAIQGWSPDSDVAKQRDVRFPSGRGKRGIM